MYILYICVCVFGSVSFVNPDKSANSSHLYVWFNMVYSYNNFIRIVSLVSIIYFHGGKKENGSNQIWKWLPLFLTNATKAKSYVCLDLKLQQLQHLWTWKLYTRQVSVSPHRRWPRSGSCNLIKDSHFVTIWVLERFKTFVDCLLCLVCVVWLFWTSRICRLLIEERNDGPFCALDILLLVHLYYRTHQIQIS